ncbi:MAG: hypothetical protein PHF37_01830 [Phycisphaerae bacterium]|nr:hypothetical protein [Phycisphaerae bacterium]
MTSEEKNYEQKKYELLEEICENTRAIRRVVNRILDHIHEYQTGTESSGNSVYDPEELSWDDLEDHDDMYM